MNNSKPISRQIWRTCLVAMALVTSAAGVADESAPDLSLSLQEAVSLGLRNNRNVKGAYLARDRQKFDSYVSEGKFLPQFALSGSYRKGDIGGSAVTEEGIGSSAALTLPTGAEITLGLSRFQGESTSPTSTSITLSQPLLRDAGVDVSTASVRIARLDDAINLLGLEETVSRTVVQITHAYRELLRAQRQVEIASAAFERATAFVKVNDALIEAGRMARVERLQTEAEVATQEVVLEGSRNQVDASRMSLLSLLALDPTTPLRVVGDDATRVPEPTAEAVLAVALGNRPDYRASLLAGQRAEIERVVARNQSLWDLSLVASRSWFGDGTAFTAGYPQPDSSYVGLQLLVPIGDRSRRQSEVHADIATKTQELLTQEVRQAVEESIRNAVREVDTRWRQHQLAIKARDLTLLKLEAEKEKLNAGRSSNFQVLFFEGDLRNAESSVLDTHIAYLNALTDLDLQSGTLLERLRISVGN